MYVLFTADCECVLYMNMDRGSDLGKNEKKKSLQYTTVRETYFTPYWSFGLTENNWIVRS